MNYSRRTTGEEGMRLLEGIKTSRPEMPVILITAWGSIELAVRGMKAGAADFITKPWGNEQVLQSVRTALGLAASSAARAESERPGRADLDERYDLGGIIGENQKLIDALDLACRVSGTDASVLITGDSGTGKEVVAEAIHRNSARCDGPFVKVNLGGIASTLFESEMFGHVRGAFTDAHRDRQGRFAVAEGGTILLDEIGDLDLRSQVKMLRVLQDRTYEVLGSSETRTIDVRVVTATNRNLQRAVEQGRFREDLLYRINLISIHLPSLAERSDDIPLLARHFLQQAAAAYDRDVERIGDDALDWLQASVWPGNIRQLKHLIERTLLVTGASRLEAGHFEQAREKGGAESTKEKLPPVGSMTLDDIEKSMIEKSLHHHGGNISRVAESLGMSRAALYRRLRKYGIDT
jgi:DNA-binding NtrC family response regulator